MKMPGCLTARRYIGADRGARGVRVLRNSRSRSAKWLNPSLLAELDVTLVLTPCRIRVLFYAGTCAGEGRHVRVELDPLPGQCVVRVTDTGPGVAPEHVEHLILLLRFIGPRARHPRVQGMMQAVVLASAGLLMASVLPLARDAILEPVTLMIAVVGLALLLWRKVDTLWVIGGGAVISLVSALLAVPHS